MKNNWLFKLIFAIAFSMIIGSCDKDEILKSKNGFPDTAQNLSIFNSKYDDYNSALEPGEYDMYAFVFSSNRKSKGKNFDIIHYTVNMSYPFDKDIVSIGESAGRTSICLGISEMQSVLNGSNNLFGPYIHRYNLTNIKNEDDEFIFFYAVGEENDLDIKYMTYERNLNENAKYAYRITGPNNFTSINTSEFSEGYITIADDEIYYCSNTKGSYNLYKKILPQNVRLINFLSEPNNQEPTLLTELNSIHDDKCPFILNDFLVFSSNRDGGFGGYDLWYSKRINGQWREPHNFGGKINSEFDEYRPIVRKYEDINNDMMIFSSNRDGGLGGFDLYYVGITETK